MKKRRILIFFCVLFTLANLTGCGAGPLPEETTASHEETEGTTEPVTETATDTQTTEPVIEPEDVFFDDFDGEELDPDRWTIAHHNWGGYDSEFENQFAYNGGVVPENVRVKDGKLILTANGDRYEGEIKGVYPNGFERPDNHRVGAMITTKEPFASGKYEVCMRISPEMGVCSCAFTYEYEWEEDTQHEVNHEIDFEFPGRKSLYNLEDIGYNYVLITSWIGVNEGEYESKSVDLGKNMADGEFHVYTFEWHTGDKERGIKKGVDFYIDGELIGSYSRRIPFNAGGMNLGLWFPNRWAGSPDFETTTMEVDWIRITPYHEANDVFPEAQ